MNLEELFTVRRASRVHGKTIIIFDLYGGASMEATDYDTACLDAQEQAARCPEDVFIVLGVFASFTSKPKPTDIKTEIFVD